MRPPLSATWEALGDAFYRKEDVYTMLWDLKDLSIYTIAASTHAGPIALMRDPTKPALHNKVIIGKPRIFIYSSAGILLQTVYWDRDAKIVKFGFTANESLIVVAEDGTYRLYPMNVGESSNASTSLGYSQHTLGSEATDTGIIDARIYESGMVVLLANLNFIELSTWPDAVHHSPDLQTTKSTITRLADANLPEAPSTWSVIPPDVSSSRQVEVLISVRETVFLLDAIDCQNQHLTQGPFSHLVPSPNGRLIALLTSDGHKALIISSNFSRNFSEYDVMEQCSISHPSQMAWCGSHTILMNDADDSTVMIGPFGDVLRYYYDSPTYLITEVDGTRVISSTNCDFIQRVADSTWSIFRPGSATPAAILFEAAEHFEKKSSRANENIRNIKADLVGAVDICIEAAGRENDVYWQKRLLKAASFGKSFLDLYNPSDFVQMTQNLRVLNAVRHYEVGLPLTYEQFNQHAPEQVVARLTARGLHLLALRIATFLSLPQGPILQHWAAAQVSMVNSAEDAKVVCDRIVSKIRDQSEISCADIARTAWERGQTGLATRLLNYEMKASKQVPLLLNMKEDKLALAKALDSSDPNLIYSVLLHLKRLHGPANFFNFIDQKPDAIALFRTWARDNAIELLRDFNYRDDRRVDSAILVLEDSLQVQDQTTRLNKIKEAATFLNEDRERVFEAKMVEDQVKLMTYQQTLEKEADGRRQFFGLSLNETVTQCVLGGWLKKADKLKSEFKIPDKRFWMIKMKALIEVRDWDGLDAFVKSKKSPVGYEPLVEHLRQYGMLRQAVSYIPKCENRNKVELYVRCSEWKLAGEEAKNRGDKNKLLELRQRAPNSLIAAELDALLSEEGSGF